MENIGIAVGGDCSGPHADRLVPDQVHRPFSAEMDGEEGVTGV